MLHINVWFERNVELTKVRGQKFFNIAMISNLSRSSICMSMGKNMA